MVKAITQDTWDAYRHQLPKRRKFDDPPLPTSLSYEGKIEASVDYVPPQTLLDVVRGWLDRKGDEGLYYFITQGAAEDFRDYELALSDLNRNILLSINHRCPNLLVGTEFDWAVFIDHEGDIHVAGSKELFDLLKQAAART